MWPGSTLDEKMMTNSLTEWTNFWELQLHNSGTSSSGFLCTRGRWKKLLSVKKKRLMLCCCWSIFLRLMLKKVSKPKHGDWKKASLKESCTALVPYVAPKTTRSAAEASAHCSPNIYTRILSKKLSDESAGPGDAKSPPRLAATSSGPSSSSRSLGREVAWDDFNRSEKDLLAEALSKASHICFAVMLLVCTMPC